MQNALRQIYNDVIHEVTKSEEIWKTVKEVAEQTGISVRTLHYYDEIGLFKPTQVTEAGYRLYDDKALDQSRWISSAGFKNDG